MTYHGSKRDFLMQRFTQVKAERQPHEAVWKLITELISPYDTVWEPQNRNHGQRKDQKIINSRPVTALKTLIAALMAGITSPARQWWDMTTSDPDLAELEHVKRFLDQSRRRIDANLHASNFYKSLATGTYRHMASVGNAGLLHEDGLAGRPRFRAMPIGEAYIASNHESKVDTCFRQLYLNPRQIIGRFGIDAVPFSIRDAYNKGNYDHGFDVFHAIQPNEEYVGAGRKGMAGMAFASCWWTAAEDADKPLLSEHGYFEFPGAFPRWSALPDQSYGVGPGIDALGDMRELQHYAEDLRKLIDKAADPPMRATNNVKRASLVPGDLTDIGTKDQGVFEPAMTVDPAAIQAVREHLHDLKQDIGDVFYQHLWSMLIDDERNQRPTATEVEAKREEKMLLAGPVLESMNDELLEPVIMREYARMSRTGQLGYPPEELEGQELKIEFISIMHQAQKSTSFISLRTLLDEVARIREIDAEVVDKIDADALVDELQRVTRVPPAIVLSAEKAAARRKARAQLQQAEQDGQAMLAATQGMKNLSGVEPAKLSQIMGSLPPVAQAQAGAVPALGST